MNTEKTQAATGENIQTPDPGTEPRNLQLWGYSANRRTILGFFEVRIPCWHIVTHLHIIPNSKILHRWEKKGESPAHYPLVAKNFIPCATFWPSSGIKMGIKHCMWRKLCGIFLHFFLVCQASPPTHLSSSLSEGFFFYFVWAPSFELSLQKIRPCAVAGIADQTICLAKQIPSGERSWSAAPVQRAFIKNWDSARWLHKIFNIQ